MQIHQLMHVQDVQHACKNHPYDNFSAVHEICSTYTTRECDFIPEQAQSMYKYVYPFILAVGIVGNLLSLLTMKRIYFRRKNFRNFSVCLAALSIADLGVLLFGILRETIEFYFGFSVKTMNTLTCKSIHFICYVFSSFSAWIHVFIAIERYVACIKPFHINILCSGKLNQVFILIVFIICLAFNFPILLYHEIEDWYAIDLAENKFRRFKFCSPKEKYEAFAVILDYLFYFLLPVLVCLIFATATLIGLAKSEKISSVHRRTNTPDYEPSYTDADRLTIRRRSSTSKSPNFVGKPLSKENANILRFKYKNNQESECVEIDAVSNFSLAVKSKSSDIGRLLKIIDRRQQSDTVSMTQNRTSSSNIKITIMLISLPIFYILTVFPIVTLLTIRLIQKQRQDTSSDLPYSDWYSTIFSSLMYVNKSLNIFLYVIFGKNLRRDFIAIIWSFFPCFRCCIKSQQTNNVNVSRILPDTPKRQNLNS